MGKDAKIMIVDDEPLNVDVLTQELELAEYQILSASNGWEAVEKAGSEAPDLILLDIMMPGVDGYETCRNLKASNRTKDIPVIFMTVLTEVQDKIRAFEAGGIDYITKPFQIEEVLARVETQIANRRLQRELHEQNIRLQKEIDAHRRSQVTVQYLRDEIKTEHNFEEIVGESEALKQLLQKVSLVANTDTNVLIQGETGTGKELVARAIHNRGSRGENPIVKVNCAALPRELIESEIFGHEKGAFTGATRQRKGRFELAHKGTLFLDEVGELSLEAQAKLLRVLQEKEFERVGAEQSIQVDVRVIAATNRDLASAVQAGGFRTDLFYRLNVFPISVPPLRERSSDIPLLVDYFVKKVARKLGRHFDGLASSSLARLQNYAWPGNIRELENVIERAAILSPGALIEVEESLVTTPESEPQPHASGTLEEVERAYILGVLEESGWVIEGEGGAAAVLGLNPSTLRGRLRKLGVKKPE